MMRYFRVNSDAVYEAVRAQLDEAWGHPTPDGRTLSCMWPAAQSHRSHIGHILIAVFGEFLDYDPVPQLLPGLLESGAVQEISEAEYSDTVMDG